MDILKRTTESIERHTLLLTGDSVLVGLSGGPDSVALLHLLTRLRKTLALKLFAVYFNHGLRPTAARKEERFCEDICKRWRVPLTIIRENILVLAKKRRVGIEEAARDFRYASLEELASKLGCSRIALGHQADDQVETVLFRILRGTGRTGLTGIPVQRGKIIRPLLEITRAEIQAYLKSRRIDYCVDASNANIMFRRNYLRNRLLPQIRQKVNPQVDRSIRELAETLSEEEIFLDQMGRRALRRLAKATAGGKLMLDLQIYVQYPLWLRRRIIRIAVAELAGNRLSLDKSAVDRIDQAALSGTGSISIGKGIQVEIVRHKIVFARAVGPTAETAISIDNQWVKARSLTIELRARVSRRTGKTTPKIRRGSRVMVDRQKLTPPFSIRSIRAGDRFVPLGMKGRKKVGDYLTDRKFPAALRDEVLAVCDSDGIVWLVGFEIADRVKIDSATTEVVTLEYRTVKTRSSKTV